MPYVSVAWFEPGKLAPIEWTAKREQIAAALSAFGAHSPEDAVSTKEVLGVVGGDYSNLRKVMEQTPGVVKVMPTPYKSKAQQTWYYLPEFKQASIDDLHFYPLNGIVGTRWPATQVRARNDQTDKQVRDIYYSHYGKATTATVTKADFLASGNAEPLPKQLADKLTAMPDTLKAVTVIALQRPGYTFSKANIQTSLDTMTDENIHGFVANLVGSYLSHLKEQA